eukprot:5512889-Prymnesium_polylepis.5
MWHQHLAVMHCQKTRFASSSRSWRDPAPSPPHRRWPSSSRGNADDRTQRKRALCSGRMRLPASSSFVSCSPPSTCLLYTSPSPRDAHES